MDISDWILSKDKNLQKINATKGLSVYRIILILSAGFVLASGYFFRMILPNAFDQIIVRIAISIVMFSMFFLTFLDKKYRQKVYLDYFIICCYGAYLLVLIQKNNFSVYNILELSFLIFIVGWIFGNKLFVNAYLLIVVTIYVIMYCMYVESSMYELMKVMSVSFFCMVSAVFFNFKKHIENQISTYSNVVNVMFNESSDGIVLVDSESMAIINCNKKFVEIFKVPSKENLFGLNVDIFFLNPFLPNLFNEGGDMKFKANDGTIFFGNMSTMQIGIRKKKKWVIRIYNIILLVEGKKEIEENGKILAQVMDLLPHHVFLKDSEGKFVLVNKTILDVYNTSMKNIIGKKDIDFVKSPDEAKHFFDTDMKIINSGMKRNISEEYLTDHHGEVHILQTTKIPFYFEKDSTIGVLGVAIDVTKNKLAEKVIRDSESKYKVLMEQASDGIYLSDQEGNILEANLKACEMFGYLMEEFLELNIQNLVDPVGIKYSPVKIPDLKDNKSIVIERRFIKKDGTFFTVEMSAKLLDDGRHQAIIRDITGRKKLENILKDNERKFRLLIENSSDIILILSEDFKIKFISPSVHGILNFMPDEVIGMKAFEFVHQKEVDKILAFLSEALSKPNGKHVANAVRLKNKSGGYIFVEVVAVNFLVDPVINGIIVNCHDITKRKNIEDKLLNSNFELDSFVYRVSHDLKAPLKSMVGLIKLAQMGTSDSDQHQYFDMMNKSVTGLDTFITDLTQFSRNSRMDIEVTEINFEDIIAKSLNNLRYMERAEEVSITNKILLEYKFYSDVTRVSTIINNLISNAYKYHRFENNNPYINITINVDMDKADIIVEDNGLGIDVLYIDKIFNMFYRASENSYGSGLGLYIVKCAINKLNGVINVESVVNHGSKFIIMIPNLIKDIK